MVLVALQKSEFAFEPFQFTLSLLELSPPVFELSPPAFELSPPALESLEFLALSQKTLVPFVKESKTSHHIDYFQEQSNHFRWFSLLPRFDPSSKSNLSHKTQSCIGKSSFHPLFPLEIERVLKKFQDDRSPFKVLCFLGRSEIS